MTNPIRAALERLIEALDDYEPTWGCFPESALADARAALAEQQGKGPSDDQLDLVVIAIQALTSHQPDATTHDLHAVDRGREILRNALARWGHQPAPPAEGEVGELVKRLRDWHTIPTLEERARAAELLQQQHPAPVPVSERPPGAADIHFEFVVSDADYCTQAGGIAPTYAQALSEGQRYLAQYQQDGPHTLELRRIEVLHPGAFPVPDDAPLPTPVPVSERLPAMVTDGLRVAGDCDEQGRCWAGTRAFVDTSGDRDIDYPPSWELREVRAQDDVWLPAHALPLPQGGVE